jgi:hypothetical protein
METHQLNPMHTLMVPALLHLLAMEERTTIPLTSPTRDKLRAAKVGAETYDDVVRRLLGDNSVEGGQ